MIAAWLSLSSSEDVGGHRRFRPSVLAERLSKYDVVNVGATGTFVVATARVMELLALVAREAVKPIKSEPDIVSSAEAFWKPWRAA
jgi:hypothetical protein